MNLRLKADCVARGANRVHLTNSCFRIPFTGAIVADKRDGAFADDLYLVMEDNRNGTRDSTNSDVFFFKSLNGGSTWIGPTRVNDDPSNAPANRDCGRAGQPACPAGVNTGNDQWWPWIDLNEKGHLNVVFKDRRLDTDSIASEWPTSRARPGNYLVWTWGAQCTAKRGTASECVGDDATEMAQPVAPVNPSGAYPGAGPSALGDWDNFGISDVPSNWDYSFRSGIFCRRLRGSGHRRRRHVRVLHGRAQRPLVRRAGRRSHCSVAAGQEPRLRAIGRVRRPLRLRWGANGQNRAEAVRLAVPRHALSRGLRTTNPPDLRGRPRGRPLSFQSAIGHVISPKRYHCRTPVPECRRVPPAWPANDSDSSCGCLSNCESGCSRLQPVLTAA